MLAEVEAELQRLTPERRARGAEGVADLLRLLGPLSTDEVAGPLRRRRRRRRGAAALAAPAGPSRCGWPARPRWTAIEDVGRLRDGLGVAVPPGTPDAFTDPVEDPLADLVSRYARTHGPFTTDDVAARLGLGAAVVRHTLQRLAAQGRVLDGEFRPGGSGLGVVRRRGAALAAPPVAGPAAQGGRAGPAGRARPVPARLAARRRPGLRGVDGVLSVIDQLAGAPVPASALEPLVLAARVRDYEPSYLDELTAAGEVLWAGHGVAARRRRLGLAAPRRPGAADPARARARSSTRELHQAVLDALAPGGAWFFRQLADAGRLDRRPGPVAPPCGTSSGPAGSATTP